MTTGRWLVRGSEAVLAHRHRTRRSGDLDGSAPSGGSAEPHHAVRPAGVLALQRSAGNAATVALLTRPGAYVGTGLVLQRKTPKAPPPEPTVVAGKQLQGVEAWADTEAKRQHVIDSAAVVGLDPKQAASVREAAAKLTAYAPTIRAAAGKVDPSIAALKSAVALAAKARSLTSGRHDRLDELEAQHARNESADAVGKAIGLVAALSPGIDTKILSANLTAAQKALAGSGSLSDATKTLNSSIDELQKVKDAALKRADSAVKVAIVLRGFLAVNDPAFAGAPTAAEIAQVKSGLAGGIGEEISDVFGSSVDYMFFVDFANAWGQQLDARASMTAASGRAAAPVPDRSDAQTYFSALAKKSNGDLFAAYTEFASAFFVHRGIATEADLRRTVDDLFTGKAAITGRRGLVCTGYAVMGAEVLGKAGAKLTGFSVGVHVDDDMVRSGRFDEQGHAIARMTRGGTAFSVSNDVIVPTANALVGKGAISWGDTSKLMIVGDGKTMDAAVDDLLAKIAARRRVLERRK
ncbi:hypothetical protein [Microlunatus ginsengisoli]|uniref:Uncharacterized protein n=1 Tax=Microlunatus ginsengisoli TaxID=363863 RepID=A0ABP7A7L0_9ACTN